MNWETWEHVIRNKQGKVVFFGPFEACISFFLAGRGSKFGWVIKKEPKHV